MNTELAPSALEVARRIDATLAETWQAWTDPDLVSRWFAPGKLRAEVLAYDVRPGGTYRIRMQDEDGSTHTVAGRFLEVRPERRLVMSWAWEDSESVASRVSVQFAGQDDGTEVTVCHEGLESDEAVEAHNQGWQGCLENLVQRIDAMTIG